MDTAKYEWFAPSAVRRMLMRVRGFEVPTPTLTYWRRVLNIKPSTEPLTKGLYSAQDVVDLAGGIIWMDSDRPLSAYGALLDAGYRLAETYVHELETLTLVKIIEVQSCPETTTNQTVTATVQQYVQQQIQL